MFTTKTFKQALLDGDVTRTLEWIDECVSHTDMYGKFEVKTVNERTGQQKTFVTLYRLDNIVLYEKSIEETCRFLFAVMNVQACRGLSSYTLNLLDVHDYHGSILNNRKQQELRYILSNGQMKYGQYTYKDTKKIIELLEVLKPEIKAYDIETAIKEYYE